MALTIHHAVATVTFILLASAASPCRADAPPIAVSAAHKARVVPDGAGPWCGERLALRMELEPDSPDLGDATAQAANLGRLKDLLARDCPSAASAVVTVVSSGRQVARFVGGRAGGWAFAPAPSAPAPLAAASGPPAPNAPGQLAPEAPKQAAPAPVAAQQTPPERDFHGALLALIRQKPELAGDADVVAFWASFRHPREYAQLLSQEFRLAPLLADARADLAATVAATPPGLVLVTIAVQFGPYDFGAQRFPLAQRFARLALSRPCCLGGAGLPSDFVLDAPELEFLDGLPMAPDDARRFVEQRTGRGNAVDRSLILRLFLRIGPPGFTMSGQRASASATVEQAAFLENDRGGAELARIDGASLRQAREAKAAREAAAQADAARAKAEQARAAEAARAAEVEARARQQAEAQRQQMSLQRGELERELADAPISTRLANAVADGPVNTGLRLDDLRGARTQALLARRPAAVTMLVQAAGGGTRPATWPRGLTLILPGGAERGWHLVRGTLAVPEGDDAPPAQLTAESVIACAEAECADAADPAAVLRRKLGPDASP